jgi:hypothetical protein
LPPSKAPIESSDLPSDALFLEVESSLPAPAAAYIARSRVVKIDFSVLLDESGRARNLRGDPVALNLFPDVTYTGVIEQIEENGDGFSWTGHLKDVEYSSLIMIFTGGTFIANISSPGGVYEVSRARGDFYRVVLIDQQKFQGGEDVVGTPPTYP